MLLSMILVGCKSDTYDDVSLYYSNGVIMNSDVIDVKEFTIIDGHMANSEEAGNSFRPSAVALCEIDGNLYRLFYRAVLRKHGGYIYELVCVLPDQK